MRALLFLLFLIPFLTDTGYAQKSPDFSTTLYFEDAKGNKDSVVIGYDSDTPPRYDDPDFGEVPFDFETPFDTVFEVRISEGAPGYTKVEILSYKDCGADLHSRRLIEIHVKIIHTPLKVSWDRNAFDDFCHERSFIQGHLLGPLLGDYSDVTYFVDTDSVVYSDEELLWKSVVVVQNEGIDTTIRVMHMQFIAGETAVMELSDRKFFQVFPNPTRGAVAIELEDWNPTHLSIYSLDGRLLEEQILRSVSRHITKSLKNYSSGTYLLILRDDKGNSYSKKLVKIE